MPEMVDSAQLLYTLLANAMSCPVYGPPGLPLGYAGDRPCITFTGDGGADSLDVPIGSERFWFRSYGTSPQEARKVDLELQSNLTRRGYTEIQFPGGTAVLRSANKESGPQDSIEPETGWHFVISAYRIIFLEYLRS